MCNTFELPKQILVLATKTGRNLPTGRQALRNKYAFYFVTLCVFVASWLNIIFPA